MPTAWLQYWNPEQLAVQGSSDGQPLRHTAGKQFDRVEIGDTVYVFGISGDELVLVGRLIVTKKQSHAEYSARHPNAYQAPVHLVGTGTVHRLDRIVPAPIARRLRRESDKPLLPAGRPDGQSLQAVGRLEEASRRALDLLLDGDDVEVSTAGRGYVEGGVRYTRHLQIERNRAVRAAALRIHGTTCQVCGFSFERNYGSLGAGFAEVHHLAPLSTIRGRTVVTNPAADTAVVCANCHRMIHRDAATPLTPDELRQRHHT